MQRPRPRLLVGGYSEPVLRRAATLADGYTGGNMPLAELATVVARVKNAARIAGRDPARFPVVCRGSFRLTADPLGAGRRALSGSEAEIRDDIRRYAEAGVTELFLEPNFQPGGAELASVLRQFEVLAPKA